MDIVDARKKKEELEFEIRKLLDVFTKETGLPVRNINLLVTNSYSYSYHTTGYYVRCEVML